jgi:two-component system, OmpR family, response regulator
MENRKINVLLAEDDPNLGMVLKTYLEAKGFDVHLTTNGEEAYQTFVKNNFDICLFDIMMPVKDGYTLAKEIRENDKKIPILFTTAKSMQQDVLDGFESGADDYITKPFSMEELLVRMKAIIRRSHPELIGEHIQDNFTIGKYTFEYTRQVLTFGDLSQKLTSKEADLLKLLCERKNDVLDRSYALTKIWNDDSYFNARSMDVYITKLRKYLKQDPEIELMNVHGVGFKLVVND